MLENQTAQAIAQKLVVELFSRFGYPLEILSDRGANFLSKVLQELYKLCNIKQLRTSSYHPMTSGSVEAHNKILIQTLRTCCPNEDEWESYLPHALMAMRATSSVQTTQFSPYFALFGREMPLFLDTLLPLPGQGQPQTITEYVRNLLPRLEVTRSIGKANIEAQQA